MRAEAGKEREATAAVAAKATAMAEGGRQEQECERERRQPEGEQERQLGIPVTPFMDRPTASIPKAQLGFLKYLCQPLFKAMAAVVPSPTLVPCNHLIYRSLQSPHGAQPLRALERLRGG